MLSGALKCDNYHFSTDSYVSMQKDGKGNVHMAGKICDHPFDINIGMYAFGSCFLTASGPLLLSARFVVVKSFLSVHVGSLLLFCRILNDAKDFANDVWESLKKLVSQ